MLTTISDRAIRGPSKADIRLAQWRAFCQAEETSAEQEDPRTTPCPVSPERLQLSEAGILHLSPIVKQLVELWRGPQDDDYGQLRPTPYAFDKAVDLLIDAAIVARMSAHSGPRQIPYGCVSTDAAGGVRIDWMRTTRSVRLSIPPTKEGVAYVYHEDGDAYATDDATPERLWHWLGLIA
jgi:hypothetical protein